MEFILPFQISPSDAKIDYGQKILLIGSCFTEQIGKQLKDLKFDVLQNPNGIIYDPLSIATSLNSYSENKIYAEKDLFQHNDLWHSWQHHSAFSGISKTGVLEKINQFQSQSHHFVKNASWLIITLGTAYHYKIKESGGFVANCHKMPASNFEKQLMEVGEIIPQLSATIGKLRLTNAGIKIIFTVSPVRHIRDGLVENNRSKARLIEAIHSIVEKNANVFYFPAYELVIDVLRDYRFYNTDLVHVSEPATRYVFEKFCDVYFDNHAKKLMLEIQSLKAAIDHRPFQSESTAHKKFLELQLEKALQLQELHPSIDLTKEISYFQGGN